MKRMKKLLCLTLVLMVLLAGAYGARQMNPELSDDSGEAQGGTLLALETGDIIALSLDYSGEVSFEKTGEGWRYTADSAFPVDEGRINAMLTALTELKTTKTIEDPGELSQYGLDEPACSISLTAAGDSQVLIGNETDMGGERYLSLGDGKVYLTDASILDSFRYGLMDLVKKEVLPAMNAVERFTVTSGDKHYEIDYMEDSGLAYSDEYVWFLNEAGEYRALDTVAASSFVAQITGLTWGNCVSYNADEEELAGYGLDEPQLTVQVDYIETVQVDTGMSDSDGNAIYDSREESRSFTLEIGDYAGDQCYARIAGSHMVYQIDAGLCDDLLYATYEKLQPDEVLALDFEGLTGLDIELDGESYRLEHSIRVEAGENGDTRTVDAWTLDGREADIQSLMEEISYLKPSDKGSAKTPQRPAEIRLVFHQDRENFREVELIFYQYDSENCLVSLNGEARLLVDREDVEEIVTGLREQLQGDDYE